MLRSIALKTLRLLEGSLDIGNEEKQLLCYLSALGQGKTVLDVGCGYGRKLQLIRSCGLDAVGVEINRDIVRKNQEAGLACMTVEAFDATRERYDVILMSHVIEHFTPGELFSFMDRYLDRLAADGHLIIVTPLASPYFYEDFDHVKPYHPTGINMVFCGNTSQVQYYSRNKLRLLNVWFRRSPYRLVFSAPLHSGKACLPVLLANAAYAFLYRITFGMVGRTDGWIGVYRKVSA